MDSLPPVILEKGQEYLDLIINYAPKIVIALLVYLIGRFIVKKLTRSTEKGLRKLPNLDETLIRFIVSTLLMIGSIAVIIAAMTALGIPMGFVATIVGAMVLALGFALKDRLGDFASGVMLLLFRPYAVGEEVEIGGESGKVTELGLLKTRLNTVDNVELLVPNGAAFGNTIKNYNAFGTRRLDLDFGVSYDADLNTAIKTIMSIAENHPEIHKTPAPWAKVVSLDESAVTIQLRAWLDAKDYRAVKMDMFYAAKKALTEAKIEIPYPHAVILTKEEA